jgi:hypothetical protein
MRLFRRDLAVFPVLLCLASLAPCRAARGATVEFNRDVRPILSENCFVCHGPGKEDRKANLRLDLREVALEHKAIVPGKPDQSKLVQHVFSTDPKKIMPPPESNKKLTAAEKETLRSWVAAGATYEPFWAYVKPARTKPPSTRDSAWVQNPIDTFILHMLEAKGLKPSPEADRATLLRRLSLDLIGLPPSPAEVSAFVADTRPGSYERQVDRLLASPHFGERMAVPWLDVVRFADTVGYHGDQNVNIFPYRDYVVNAFNTNKPFDQFTIEQLAGDLLPNPTIESRIATGFNRLNMMTREGGAQPKEYLAKYASDRVRTISMAWLGSTMGCAECHDHKFDPFTSKDFYSMEAFFADIQQWGVYAYYGYTPEPDLKGINNDDPFPPEIEVKSPYLARRIKHLEAERDAIYAQAAAKLAADASRRQAFDTWRQASLAFLNQNPTGWATPVPNVTIQAEKQDPGAQTNFIVATDGTVSFEKSARKNVRITLRFRVQTVGDDVRSPSANEPISRRLLTSSPTRVNDPAESIAAIRLEIVARKSPDEKSAATEEEATIALQASLKSATNGTKTKLTFLDAEADHKTDRFANGFPIIGVRDRWLIATDTDHQTGVWVLDKPITAKVGDELVLDLGRLPVASARLSLTPFATPNPLDCGIGRDLQAALEKNSADDDSKDNLVNRTYLLSTVWDPETIAQSRKLEREVRECRDGRAYTLVTVARSEPRITKLLHRGEWQDETGEILQSAVPHFLPQIPNPEERRLTRLDLAHWLVSPDNPLTARTVMNRLWKQFFGTGISAVVDDLGGQGEWPVHPELLDWLACEFMHPELAEAGQSTPHDWDFKHMVKLMVMSATYRQNSKERPELKELDPNNRLLARQSPRRLEAEFVRDNALFISGLLNEDIGGPSVHPYQPAGYYANLQFPDRDYYADLNDLEYRRGVYMHWQRTFLHPMLANFDAPSREECTASRVVSNTPQQALTLLNDPTFVEASRIWADRLLEPATEPDDQRLDRAFHRALARAPTVQEKSSLLNFLAEQRSNYEQNAADAQKLLGVGIAPVPQGEKPVELAAWTQVCRVILNLHETITCY